MNKNVIIYAINDLKTIINEIESKVVITQKECDKLEKELNSFLVNLSAYRIRHIEKSNQNQLLSGFQYACNLMKHEISLITVKKINKGGCCFPISFPFSSPCTEISWIDVNDIILDSKFENQHKNYLKTLNKKRIMETIEELENVLKIKSKEK